MKRPRVLDAARPCSYSRTLQRERRGSGGGAGKAERGRRALPGKRKRGLVGAAVGRLSKGGAPAFEGGINSQALEET